MTSALTQRTEASAEIHGLSAFVRLEGDQPRRFRKEVLRVWSGVDPNTKRALSFDRPFLEKLAANTNRWISLGHEVYAPDGHTDSAMANLGSWSRFEVEGDKLYGTFEAADDDVASKIGTRIRGVSIFARGPELASSGEQLEAVILHCCLTPCPVLPGQSNFVRLARTTKESPMLPETTTAASSATTGTQLKLATDPAADPAAETVTSTMSPKDAGKALAVLLGLDMGAGWDEIVQAVRSCLIDEADEEAGGSVGVAMPPAYMARLARAEKKAKAEVETKLSQRIADLEKLEEKRRTDHAAERVALARKTVADAGRPELLDKDAEKDVLSLLSSPIESLARSGRREVERIELAAKSLATGASVRVAKSETTGAEEAAVAESDKATAELLLTRGLKWDPKTGKASKV